MSKVVKSVQVTKPENEDTYFAIVEFWGHDGVTGEFKTFEEANDWSIDQILEKQQEDEDTGGDVTEAGEQEQAEQAEAQSTDENQPKQEESVSERSDPDTDSKAQETKADTDGSQGGQSQDKG